MNDIPQTPETTDDEVRQNLEVGRALYESKLRPDARGNLVPSREPPWDTLSDSEKARWAKAVLNAQMQPCNQTTVRTVRIRALVIVDADGKWTVMGDGQNDDKQIREWAYDGSGDLGHAPWGEYWIEATVPIPVQTSEEAIEGEIANG